MKYSNLGIGLLLFAILLEMCSIGIILMLRSSGFGHTGCIVTKTKR